MTIAFGQQSALRDLEAIAREGDALEIINVAEPKEEDGFLLVELSLSFEGGSPVLGRHSIEAEGTVLCSASF